MILHAPQIIFIFLIMLQLGVDLERNGTAKTGDYNFMHSLGGAAITLGLIWWGGFFG